MWVSLIQSAEFLNRKNMDLLKKKGFSNSLWTWTTTVFWISNLPTYCADFGLGHSWSPKSILYSKYPAPSACVHTHTHTHTLLVVSLRTLSDTEVTCENCCQEPVVLASEPKLIASSATWCPQEAGQCAVLPRYLLRYTEFAFLENEMGSTCLQSQWVPQLKELPVKSNLKMVLRVSSFFWNLWSF
jgi:hypothetical protein